MENIIKEYIIKNAKLKLEKEDIQDNSSLVDDFGFDSLQMIQLIVDIEEHFEFMFEEEDLFIEQLGTFGAFKELIAKKCESKLVTT